MSSFRTTACTLAYLSGMAVRDGVDEGVEVESWQVRVLRLDEDHRGIVVPGEAHIQREAIVQVGEGNAVLRPDWLPNDDLVDVIELIPILFTVCGGVEEWNGNRLEWNVNVVGIETWECK